jgi:hypothetical protein
MARSDLQKAAAAMASLVVEEFDRDRSTNVSAYPQVRFMDS